MVNVTGGVDITLLEVDIAANHIRESVGNDDANIIFGSSFDANLDGAIRVSVIATGIIDQELDSIANKISSKDKSIINHSHRLGNIKPVNKTESYTSKNTNFQVENRSKPVVPTLDNGEVKKSKVKMNLFNEDNRSSGIDSMNSGRTGNDSEFVSTNDEKIHQVNYDLPTFLRNKNRKPYDINTDK